MLEIPLEATPNQSFLVALNGQDCTVALYQRGKRLYLDLCLGKTLIRQGAVCLPRVGLLGTAAGFIGQLYITDERNRPEEQQPPQWQGLGTRYKLYYLSPEETAALAAQRNQEALDG